MHEVCTQCQMQNSCRNKDPIKMDGSIPTKWYYCVRYSCKAHLDDALESKKKESSTRFIVGWRVVSGWLFGSPDKPTNIASERFNKFVSGDGAVYIKDNLGDQVWAKTGQRFW